MSWTDERQKYDAIMREVEPAAMLCTKDHWFWSAAWWFLAVITLGLIAIKMSKRRFLDDFATTLGPWHGYPRQWSRLSKRLLVHEGRHTTQFVFCGYFVPVLGWIPGSFGRKLRAVVGLLPMAIVYGLLLLPIYFALGRWLLELDADRTSWRWQIRNGYTPEQVLVRASRFGNLVTSGAYLWAWPRWAGGVRVFERSADKVIREAA
jgi:hypothetical protein